MNHIFFKLLPQAVRRLRRGSPQGPGAALHRMNARNHDVPAGSGVDVLLDACFPDQRIQACFPKMTLLE